MKKPSRSLVVFTFLALAFFILMIVVNWFAFQYFAKENYFVWYIKNGTFIGIIVSFVALIWEGLSFRNDLLSAHPLYYLRGCFALLAAYYRSLAAHFEKNPESGDKINKGNAVPEFNFPLDGILSFVVIFFMFIFGLAWLVIIAPLNYFITIFTGVIARQELGGTSTRAIVIETDNEYVLSSIPRNQKLPDKAIDISLAAKPFAITQTITALVLFVVKAFLGL